MPVVEAVANDSGAVVVACPASPALLVWLGGAGGGGFQLEFEFYANNPFFKNKTLTKAFIYKRDEEHYAGGLVYGEAPGDTIVRKKGWSLVSVVVQGGMGKSVS